MDFSFWSIQSKDRALVNHFLKQLGYTTTKSEKSSLKDIDCSKLWHRKYFFSGATQAVLIQKQDYFFLLEKIPSTLFYADLINADFSKEHGLKTLAFFHYPSAKSCGLKIFEEGVLSRHLQSEIDYEICQNIGAQMPFEAEVEKEVNQFESKDLQEYLIKMEVPLPIMNTDDPVDLLSMKR